MAKKDTGAEAFGKGDVKVEGAWTYIGGTGSVEGRRILEPGVILEVTGRTLDEARASAAQRDQQIRQQTLGQQQQRAAQAARLRAEADALEAS